MLLTGNGKLFSPGPEGVFIENGAVVTDGDVIKETGEYPALFAKYPDAEFVDAHGGLIMPGFINAHTHIYSALARGLPVKGYSPRNFYEVLEGMWWKLDRLLTHEDIAASAYAALTDCIKQGVTTVFDHHAGYFAVPGSLFVIARVAEILGIRSCLCFEVSDRNGEEKCLEAISENSDFITYTEKQNDDMTKAMFGLHASFTLSDKTLERCVLARPERTGYHIHVSEGIEDVIDSFKRYGKSPVRRLIDFGISGEKTIYAHCVNANAADLRLIAEAGCVVVNCPQSNMGNAVGCAPVLDMFGSGVLVGLGTDAFTNDMPESMRAMLTSQRHNTRRPGAAFNEAAAMLLQNNAAAAGRFFSKPLGTLTPGAAADIIVADLKPFTPLDLDTVNGHLMFGMSGLNCLTTIVNGRLLMKDRELVGVDEEEMRAKILEISAKLWSRF